MSKPRVMTLGKFQDVDTDICNKEMLFQKLHVILFMLKLFKIIFHLCLAMYIM